MGLLNGLMMTTNPYYQFAGFGLGVLLGILLLWTLKELAKKTPAE